MSLANKTNQQNILLISHEYPPDSGGAGTLAQEFLLGAVEAGHRVTLLTRSRKTELYRQGSFSLVTVPDVPKLCFITYWLKIKKLDLSKYDLILLNGLGSSIIAVAIHDQYLGKCTLWFHGSEFDTVFKYPKFPYIVPFFRNKYLQLLQRSSRSIAVSRDLRGRLQEGFTAYGLSPSIHVVEGCLDTDVLFRDEVNLHQRFALPPIRKLLLSVSRIVRKKGYERMLDVFMRLVDAGEDYHWIVVGDGPFLNEFKEKVEKSGYGHRVLFVGALNRSELRKYYSSVDLFWLLSEFREAFPLVYLESMACGTPVIAWDHGGCSEVLSGGKYGILVNTVDRCLQEIIGFDCQRFDRIQLADYAGQFTRSTMTQKILRAGTE